MRKLWLSEVGASYEHQLTCRTDRHLLSFVFFEHHMNSDYIDPYIYEFYTQMDFRRVYEHMKQTSDEKVMIVRSWHSRARSLLSSAKRAKSKEVSSCSSCRRAHTAHAEELMPGRSCSSCRRAHAEDLMQLMRKSSCSSCRSAHADHAEELMQLID